MTGISLTKSFLLVLLGGIFFLVPASAQPPACDLQLRIQEVGVPQDIEGAEAAALNLSNKKSQPAVIRDGLLTFTGLEHSNRYRITITKPGYKQSVASIVLECVDLVNGVVMDFIRMKKGDSSRIFNTKAETLKAFKVADIEPEIVPAPATPPPPPPAETPKIVSRGVINGAALVLAKPKYPRKAKAAGASGTVAVEVTIDEEGKITSATAVSGHPLLRSSAVEAAKASKFKPTLLEGRPVKVSGIIVYNFH